MTAIDAQQYYGNNADSFNEIVVNKGQSVAGQVMAFGDDAKSSVSMRVEEEPTEITNRMIISDGGKTKTVMQNANIIAEVLDGEDMTFDMTMQHSQI